MEEKYLPPEITAYFKEEFDDPYIEKEESPLDGITVFSVFERRDLVADPIIPTLFYMTEGFRFFENACDALNEISFEPKDENDALRIATWILGQNDLYSLEYQERMKVKKEGAAFICTARVSFQLLHPFFGKSPRQVANVRIILEKGGCSIRFISQGGPSLN